MRNDGVSRAYCEHGCKKKNTRGRSPKIDKKTQINVFKKMKIRLVQNCRLKKRTDRVFDDIAKELGMSRSATYFAVKRNLKNICGDDSLLSNNTTADSNQIDSSFETTAGSIDPNETPVKLKKTCLGLLKSSPISSTDIDDVSPTKGKHFRFDAKDQDIFKVIKQTDKGRGRHYAAKGWADKLNDFIWGKLRYGCTWSFKRARVREFDIECDGIYTKHISTKCE